MIAFEQSSYLAQVRRLREMARLALRSFPIKVKSIELINHGENATFKVTATNGTKYLLRIHRNDYHSKSALLEESQWLRKLCRDGLCVPRAFHARNGEPIISVHAHSVGTRYCDMFQWIDGVFLSKSISEDDMFAIGVLLAKIQHVGRKVRGQHRRYWNSDGLVGTTPKFGSIDRLGDVNSAEQKKVTDLRKRILARLKSYERANPQKMGFIHADLHFRNLLKTRDGIIAAIDFDDCGHGFFVYDLAIPLVGLEYQLKEHKRFRLYPSFKKALIAGYSSQTEFTNRDLSVLQDLIIARKLLMLGWLQSRSDNPKLRGRVKTYARNTLKYAANPNL